MQAVNYYLKYFSISLSGNYNKTAAKKLTAVEKDLSVLWYSIFVVSYYSKLIFLTIFPFQFTPHLSLRSVLRQAKATFIFSTFPWKSRFFNAFYAHFLSFIIAIFALAMRSYVNFLFYFSYSKKILLHYSYFELHNYFNMILQSATWVGLRHIFKLNPLYWNWATIVLP